MLSAKYRLNQEKDFKKINAFGRSFFSPGLRLKYLANQRDFSRFAVVVSLKVSKKAIQRNRLKRQLREIIRLNQEKIKPGYDIAVIVGSSARGRKYQQLQQDLSDLLVKARLLK